MMSPTDARARLAQAGRTMVTQGLTWGNAGNLGARAIEHLTDDQANEGGQP
ncbi:hypothetical protein BH24DEI1_BH24DEI1_07160 [soil metagenome]|jgi:ribulose-5-phosphate 4-epimerase/fuculose-1-phosphate aldolase|nr:hypothetical protein [Deinococcota bacterium]